MTVEEAGVFFPGCSERSAPTGVPEGSISVPSFATNSYIAVLICSHPRRSLAKAAVPRGVSKRLHVYMGKTQRFTYVPLFVDFGRTLRRTSEPVHKTPFFSFFFFFFKVVSSE